MRLTSELIVDAPLERTWPALLELGGPVSVDLGGEYEGAARLDDADEDEHAAGFHAQARETEGHGMATATIAARLSESEGTTRVEVETELRLTGAATPPDQEGLQRVADELLARLVERLAPAAAEAAREHSQADRSVAELARELLAAQQERERQPGARSPAPARSEPPQLVAPDPVVVAGKVAERALLVVAGVALGLAVGRLLWRRG